MAYKEYFFNRVDRFGTNPQQRIQGQKERDFMTVLNKSANRSIIRQDGTTICDGILHSKTNSDKEVVDYLLTPVAFDFPDGTILSIEQMSNGKEKLWMPFHSDDFVSSGYNRFQAIQLDKEIQWILDGIPYSTKVHFTGVGSNLRDKAITKKFLIQFQEAGVYIPNKMIALIMKTDEHMKKGVLVLINHEVWKVSGIDKISIDGVSYVTLQEDYSNSEEQIANEQAFDKWEITSTFGQKLRVVPDGIATFDLAAFFDGQKRDVSFLVSIDGDVDNASLLTDKEKEEAGITSAFAVKVGPEDVLFFLDVNIDGFQGLKTSMARFIVRVSPEERAYIVGDKFVLKQEEEATYSFHSNAEVGEIAFVAQEGLTVLQQDGNTVKIQARDIGDFVLFVKSADLTTVYAQGTITVQSFWT